MSSFSASRVLTSLAGPFQWVNPLLCGWSILSYGGKQSKQQAYLSQTTAAKLASAKTTSPAHISLVVRRPRPFSPAANTSMASFFCRVILWRPAGCWLLAAAAERRIAHSAQADCPLNLPTSPSTPPPPNPAKNKHTPHSLSCTMCPMKGVLKAGL